METKLEPDQQQVSRIKENITKEFIYFDSILVGIVIFLIPVVIYFGCKIG